MKSTILWLAVAASIVTTAPHAMAQDNQNLSCITEVTAEGIPVRDCGLEPVIKLEARKEPTKAEPGAATHDHDGGPKRDREDQPRR